MKRKIIVIVIINMQKGDGHDEIQDLHGVNIFKVVHLKLRKETRHPTYTNSFENNNLKLNKTSFYQMCRTTTLHFVMPINALRFEGAASMAQKITASSFTKSQKKALN